ncbi:MAG: Rrf2 family transcriptional regulator [Eubacterium sp.]|nr:Rrf2 family transcriptional regulator [Eubacterium sp.]
MISTKGRYALRVMIDLAENTDGHYIALKDVAERQGISKKYLEIIVKDLVTNDMITGIRGKSGGYKLCRKPEEYTVQEILDATEGPLAAVACLSKDAAECPRSADCKTLPMWKEYDELTRDFFHSKKLSDLI